MPSLRSNKNKLSLPAFPPPAETICIPVNVPNDPQWIGLLLGAIYRLSQQVWYDRDENHTAQSVAAIWSDIYLATVKRVWGCGSEGELFDLRVSPEDECLIEKTYDGIVWFDAFRLDTCGLTKIKRNPYTGRYGYEVEDLGFYEFPDGAWEESLYPDVAIVGPPVLGPDKACLAAVTSAYVISNLYREVANKLLDVVAGTDWDYAAALGSVLQGFLLIIGAAATQGYAAFATILGIIGVRQQYVDYPLTEADIDRLTCIFLSHVTIDANGSASYDFDAVWSAIDLDSPKNGLVRFLLTMIGPDALNFTASVDAGLVAECDCDWCYLFNFSVNDGGFTVVTEAPYNGNFGAWSSLGWNGTDAMNGTTARRAVYIERLFSSTDIKRYQVGFDYLNGGNTGTGFSVQFRVAGVWALEHVIPVANLNNHDDTTFAENVALNDVTGVRVYLQSSYDGTAPYTYGGKALLNFVRLEGIANNPFGGSNCLT